MHAEEVGRDVWLYREAIPADLCARVIEAFDTWPDKAPVANRTEQGYKVFRVADVVDFQEHAELRHLAKELGECMGRAVGHHLYEVYRLTRRLMPFTFPWMEVCCYEPPEGRCQAHMDGAPGVNPVITTAVAYLNTLDENQGGETFFVRGHDEWLTVRPERGAVLIFPPGHTHMHGAKPPRVKRYLVNTRALLAH